LYTAALNTRTYCPKHCNSIANLKVRVHITLYSTTNVTTLLKEYSLWASNAMVSLKMV